MSAGSIIDGATRLNIRHIRRVQYVLCARSGAKVARKSSGVLDPSDHSPLRVAIGCRLSEYR